MTRNKLMISSCIYAFLCFSHLSRFIMGPRFDPCSLLVTLVLAPLVSKLLFFSDQYYRWTAGPPIRISDLVGFGISVAALTLRLFGLQASKTRRLPPGGSSGWFLLASNCTLFALFLSNFVSIWLTRMQNNPYRWLMERLTFGTSEWNLKCRQSFIQIRKENPSSLSLSRPLTKEFPFSP